MSSDQTDLSKLSASPGCTHGYPAMIDEGRFLASDGAASPSPTATSWKATGPWARSGTRRLTHSPVEVLSKH